MTVYQRYIDGKLVTFQSGYYRRWPVAVNGEIYWRAKRFRLKESFEWVRPRLTPPRFLARFRRRPPFPLSRKRRMYERRKLVRNLPFEEFLRKRCKEGAYERFSYCLHACPDCDDGYCTLPHCFHEREFAAYQRNAVAQGRYHRLSRKERRYEAAKRYEIHSKTRYARHYRRWLDGVRVGYAWSYRRYRSQAATRLC